MLSARLLWPFGPRSTYRALLPDAADITSRVSVFESLTTCPSHVISVSRISSGMAQARQGASRQPGLTRVFRIQLPPEPPGGCTSRSA